MARIVEIFRRGRKGLVCPTWPILWPPLTWLHKDTGYMYFEVQHDYKSMFYVTVAHVVISRTLFLCNQFHAVNSTELKLKYFERKTVKSYMVYILQCVCFIGRITYEITMHWKVNYCNQLPVSLESFFYISFFIHYLLLQLPLVTVETIMWIWYYLCHSMFTDIQVNVTKNELPDQRHVLV